MTMARIVQPSHRAGLLQGMDQVSRIKQHLKKEIASRDLGGYYQERICIWPVSKDLRGEFDVADQERQRCSTPDCLTLKGNVKLKAQVRGDGD
jgi:hypothetical protein